jgi:hypothetical protein
MRRLPTDHDYAALTREYLIHPGKSYLDRCPLYLREAKQHEVQDQINTWK